MITIDPLDDVVVQKKKPERSRTTPERGAPRRNAGADKNPESKKRSGLVALVLRLVLGTTGEEE